MRVLLVNGCHHGETKEVTRKESETKLKTVTVKDQHYIDTTDNKNGYRIYRPSLTGWTITKGNAEINPTTQEVDDAYQCMIRNIRNSLAIGVDEL